MMNIKAQNTLQHNHPNKPVGTKWQKFYFLKFLGFKHFISLCHAFDFFGGVDFGCWIFSFGNFGIN